MAFVTDTHSLVYFQSGKRNKLSKKVLDIFRNAESGREIVFIRVIVFLEISALQRRGRVAFREGSFASWVRTLLDYPGFVAQEMSIEIVLYSAAQTILKDPMDALIVATARCLDLPLITKDQLI